jgi:hypothetical protein
MPEEAEKIERRPVAPLHVVDRDDERAARGESRDQPVEGFQVIEPHARRRVVPAADPQCRARRGPCMTEERPPLGDREPRDTNFEQLTDDTEAVPALQLAAGRLEDPGAVRLGLRDRSGEERRTTRAALPVEDDEPAASTGRIGERRADRLGFDFTLGESRPDVA